MILLLLLRAFKNPYEDTQLATPYQRAITRIALMGRPKGKNMYTIVTSSTQFFTYSPPPLTCTSDMSARLNSTTRSSLPFSR